MVYFSLGHDAFPINIKIKPTDLERCSRLTNALEESVQRLSKRRNKEQNLQTNDGRNRPFAIVGHVTVNF